MPLGNEHIGRLLPAAALLCLLSALAWQYLLMLCWHLPLSWKLAGRLQHLLQAFLRAHHQHQLQRLFACLGCALEGHLQDCLSRP